MKPTRVVDNFEKWDGLVPTNISRDVVLCSERTDMLPNSNQ
jgi:hypothetical protein